MTLQCSISRFTIFLMGSRVVLRSEKLIVNTDGKVLVSIVCEGTRVTDSERVQRKGSEREREWESEGATQHRKCSVFKCGAVFCIVYVREPASARRCWLVLLAVRVLQCVAVWYSALQCVEVSCSVYVCYYRVLQCVALCCSVLQCTAVYCSVYAREPASYTCVCVCTHKYVCQPAWYTFACRHADTRVC